MNKKQNPLSFLSVGLFILIAIFLGIASCQKDSFVGEEQNVNNESDLLSVAKRFYEDNKNLPLPDGTEPSISLKKLTPNWSKVIYAINSSEEKILGVPLSYDVAEYNELVVLIHDGVPYGAIKNYRYTDEKHAILTVYSTNGTELSQGLYSFQDSLYKPTSTNRGSARSPLFTTMSETIEGGELEEVVVTPPPGGGGGGGGGGVPTPPVTPPPTGGGGGGGGAPHIVQVNIAIKPCNFNFQPAQGNDWQAAGITGIGIALVPGGPVVFNLEVAVPRFSTVLSRMIHKQEAQSVASAAYLTALQKVNVLYSQNKITPAAIPHQIAKEMETAMNRAWHPSSNSLARVTNMIGTNRGAGIMKVDYAIKCN